MKLIDERLHRRAGGVAGRFSEAMFGGDPNRVNTELAMMEKVTVADIKAMADKYLRPERATDLFVKPDPLGKEARAAATQADATDQRPGDPGDQADRRPRRHLPARAIPRTTRHWSPRGRPRRNSRRGRSSTSTA